MASLLNQMPSVEQLLDLSNSQSKPFRRSWWRVERNGSTRYLIPANRKGTAAALQLESNRLHYWTLRAKLIFSGLTGRPHVIGTSLPQCPLDSFMDSVLPGQQWHYAVYCGTPSIYQKYTIQCQDAIGRVRAYLKIGLESRAGASIRNEADTLRRLEAVPLPGISIPAVLQVTERWGCQVSVLSSADGLYARAPDHPTDAIVKFTADLFSGEQAQFPWARSPVRSRAAAAADRLDQAGEQAAAELLWKAVADLDSDFEQTPLPHGRVHGDFLPWNVRMLPQPYVFDWEWSRMALPFHDLYHYVVFPHLGSRRNRSVHAIDRFRKSPAMLRLLERARPSGLPYGCDDVRWWHAYILDSFAFYAESTSMAGHPLKDHRLIDRIAALLRLATGRGK